MDERRRIGLLYSWHTNEYILPAWVITLAIVGAMQATLWLLRLVCLGRGPGRWAAELLTKQRERRVATGSWFGFTRAYAWHHRQVLRFQALYLLFIACTCGVGLLVGAPLYILWFSRARREAEAGAWPLLPVVGRWQPQPPEPPPPAPAP
jgi:hypothetical protein